MKLIDVLKEFANRLGFSEADFESANQNANQSFLGLDRQAVDEVELSPKQAEDLIRTLIEAYDHSGVDPSFRMEIETRTNEILDRARRRN